MEARGDFLFGPMKDISYTPAMNDAVRQLIVTEAETRQHSLAELSRKLGRNHAYLQQFVKRGVPTELPERTRIALAAILGVDESQLRTKDDTPRNQRGSVKVNLRQGAPSDTVLGVRDLRVFAAVEAGPGAMVVSTDPIELVPRPWYLREVKEGFAVLVVGESMVPAYEPGDMAIVNPRLPPLRGKDMIFVKGDEHDGEFTASIKRLVNWTATEWTVCQFNPKRTFAMAKSEWPKAMRVVGRYTG